jgi:glycosyltransferase involved in cell wall biosynthesis
VVAVSRYLRGELEGVVPEARGKTEVVDCGVDLGSFSVAPAPDGPPSYLFVGSLIDRKNVLRLAEAFGRLEDADATLTVVGDGPSRPALEGRRGVRLVGAVAPDRVREHMAAARVVCQPSLVEPFGQAVLEAMARGRSVVATRVGGPAELVPDGAGLLVDPLDVGDIARGLVAAAELPCPNPAARAAAESHDVRRQAERIEAILERARAR